MTNKRLIFMIMFIILLIPAIIGVNPVTITAFYGFSNESFIDATVYKTDSLVLRIKTAVETECVYGTSSYPYIPFEGEYGLTHEIYFENIEEGFHEYYIRCGDNSNPVMKINFATSIPIYATIKISGNSPLQAGKYKVNLITSKTSLNTPVLEYSFDSIVYKTISLTGNGKNWEGNLIIPEGAGEGICSFRFKARDLTGEEGTKIVGEEIFLIDTVKPETINIIDAIGYKGQIKLNWFNEKDYEYHIYKSESSPVEYIDFYETTSKDYFYDNEVEKGETYYYKIAAVDEAGNIGELSREVYATALFENYSKNTGLDPRLIGKVDNLLAEINNILNNIEEIKSLLDLKDDEEKSIFKEIKLNNELDNSISELNSLKRDVESYKLQDLTEDGLNNKISSSSMKLNIIKKKVPEDINIIEQKEITRYLEEEDVQRVFLEYSSSTDYDYKKEIIEILKFIKTNNFKVKSKFYTLDILYLDGTKKRITFIEENINEDSEENEEIKYVLVVPKEIAERASEIKMINLDYEIIQEDPVISFSSGTDKISYYLNEEISLETLEDILISPIKISKDGDNMQGITGNSILDYTSQGSIGIFVLIVFAFILGVYFFKIKSDSSIKPVLTTMENLKKVKELLKEGKEQEAKELYNKVKEDYKLLSLKEKELISESVKEMNFGGIIK